VHVAGVASRPQQPGQPSSRARVLTVGAVLAPAVVAAALSAYELSARSLWLDESATVAIASQHGEALWAAMRYDGGNMLAYYGLVHVLISLFGNSLVVLRLPSVVATAVTAGTVSVIGLRLFNRSVGLAAGLLTAVSLPLIYWGQDARAYALMYALCALSWLGFIALVDGESARSPGKPPVWAWPLYVIALVLAMYMTFVAVLVVPAQLASLFWCRRRFRLVARGLAIAAICSLPLVVLARERGAGQLFWIPRPSFSEAAAPIEQILGSGLPPQFHLTATSLPLLGLTVALLVLIGVAALMGDRAHSAVDNVSRERWAAALVVSWLLVPGLVDTVESFVGQSVFESRYLLVSAPAASLALSCGLCSSRWPRSIGAAAVAGLLVLRFVQILPSYAVSPENWHGAADYVLDSARPGDCIAFYPADGRGAFDYYFEGSGRPAGRLPRPVLPDAPFTEVKVYVEDYQTLQRSEIRRVAASCPRLWLVSSHVGVPPATATATAHYVRYEALLSSLGRHFSHRSRATFGYAQQVDVWLFST
jgi:mannosyltransferase